MKRSLLVGTATAFFAGLLCMGYSWAAEGGGTAGKKADAAAAKSKGQVAIEAAVKSGKHLFIFFFKPDSDRAKELRPLFDDTMKELATKADAIAIDVTDPLEAKLVKKYYSGSLTLPLVLSLSPGGLIANAFIETFRKEDLQGAFLSAGEERCRKHLQDGKAVLLSVQAGTKEEREGAMAGANAFKADPQYKEVTEVVEFAANDEGEALFLKKLGVDPKTEQTVTLLVFPPTSIKARFTGATEKSALAEAMRAALNSGCGG